MVSDRDRAHFRAIAEAEAENELASIKKAAHRSPGENIEIGLRLGGLAIATGHQAEAKQKIPPIWILRKYRPPPEAE